MHYNTVTFFKPTLLLHLKKYNTLWYIQDNKNSTFISFEINMNKKSPRGIRPRRCSPPPPGGVKYVTVTQDKSPCLCSERHDEYLFGRAKTGGLGQVTTKKKKKKKTTEKKWVLLDPVLTAG